MLPLQSSLPECEWFLNGKKIEQPIVPLARRRLDNIGACGRSSGGG